MALYSYRCLNCGHEFDKILKIADYKKPCEEPCEECSAKLVEQVIKTGNGFVKSTGSGAIKPPSGFVERLKEIHRHAGKHSKIDV